MIREYDEKYKILLCAHKRHLFLNPAEHFTKDHLILQCDMVMRKHEI